MSGKVQQYRASFVRALHLESLDDHESLTFVRRHLGVRPSQLLFYALTFIAVLLLVLDGCAILASVACFLLPALRCIEEFLAADPDRIDPPEQPSSQYTDQEFSQIVSSSRARVEVAQVFTVYFSIYIITEILTPIFSWVVGSVVWLILRCLLTFALVFNSRKERLALRVLDRLRSQPMGRRNAML